MAEANTFKPGMRAWYKFHEEGKSSVLVRVIGVKTNERNQLVYIIHPENDPTSLMQVLVNRLRVYRG